VEAFDRALVLDPLKLFVASNRLFGKLYDADVPPEDYAADAFAYGRRYADPLLRRRPFANDRDPDRPLRVGFVSGDFCQHPLIRFIEPYLRAVDRDRFVLHGYMTHANEDEVTARLRPLFETWHNIAGLDDDKAADLIERESVDILVDLSGHSAGNRLMLFARKPAPVQVTWIGHPASTGLSAIDYRLTDAGTDPVGVAEPLHSERIWRLPQVTVTYQGIENLPPVRERPPFEDSGYITFGCLNRLTKVSDATLETWARILNAVPDARLFMVVGGIGTAEVREAVENRLKVAGMDVDRVIFHPRVETGYHALFHNVDIALDPYPYNGGTTSIDTLSMGVPFVALNGQQAAARTGASILRVVGLSELVAEDQDSYVTIARDLATDRDRLRAIRNGMRERLMSSPLMDHAALAADVGSAFQAMWRTWLEEGDGATDRRA
jgi:predicted O-linked N-acetylglucosamine transferase (SPINDLY family)